MSQYATFSLDTLYLGVPVTAVQEVLRFQETTPVPLAAREVGGLINLRGQIVTAIDLRRRLGLPDAPAGHQPMNVVLASADGPVSLLVDAIDDVLVVAEDAYEAPPETLAASARALITGTYKLPDRLLLVLDTERAAHATATTGA